MEKIDAIIERGADGTFTIFCCNEMFSGVGNSAEGAKNDMLKQMHFFKETAIDGNFKYPAFLDADFEIAINSTLKVCWNIILAFCLCRVWKRLQEYTKNNSGTIYTNEQNQEKRRLRKLKKGCILWEMTLFAFRFK